MPTILITPGRELARGLCANCCTTEGLSEVLAPLDDLKKLPFASTHLGTKQEVTLAYDSCQACLPTTRRLRPTSTWSHLLILLSIVVSVGVTFTPFILLGRSIPTLAGLVAAFGGPVAVIAYFHLRRPKGPGVSYFAPVQVNLVKYGKLMVYMSNREFAKRSKAVLRTGAR